MKAILVRAFGGPEVMEIATVPDPQPGQGQVVVRLMAAGVNPVETYIRAGTYGRLPDLPFTPGTDGAGVIFATGAGVPANLRTGQRVWVSGSLSGTYAEATLCDASRVLPLPGRLTFSQGAAAGIPYTTAYRALFQRGGGKPGETVLVHGATGGVGVAAVQLARAAGLRVLATGGSEEGRRMLLAQGASDVFDHSTADCPQAVLAATGGRGVDLVIEMLANVNLVRDLAILSRAGRVVVVGNRGAIELNPRDVMVKEADIRGVMILNASTAEFSQCMAAVSAGFETGALAPLVWKEFELQDAPAAHQCVMGQGHAGKVVLRCAAA